MRVNVRSFRNLMTNLEARCAVTLLTVALLIGSSPFLMRGTINQQISYRQVILVTSELLEASQALSYSAIQNSDSNFLDLFHRARELSIRKMYDQFYQKAIQLDLPPSSQSTFRAHLSEVSNQFQVFLNQLQNKSHISDIIREHQKLNASIRTCTQDLEEAISDRVTKFKRTEWALTVTLLFVLLLQGWFILRPATQKIGKTLSELKDSEKQLFEAREKAVEALKIRSEFITNISHEVRNPLNAILGMGDLLVETRLDMSQRRYLEILRRSGQSILDLLNDFLDFSRLEAGKFEIEKIRYDLVDTVERAIDIVSNRAEDKKLDLILDFDKNLPTELMGDPKRIQQILVNLLGNAIKFTSVGEVHFKVYKERNESDLTNGKAYQEELVLKICDTGIGIPKDRQSRIFDSFVQVDSSITRKFGGNGLGLTICRDLTKRMGGEISLESEENKGSTFTVRLPLEVAQQGSLLSRFRDVDLSKMNIAILDQNQKRSNAVKGFLSALKADVTEVNLEMINSENLNQYDVLLTDFGMVEAIESRVSLEKLKQNIIWFSPLRDLSNASTRIGLHPGSVCLPKPIKLSQLGYIMRDIQRGVKGYIPQQHSKVDYSHVLPPAKLLIVEDSEDNRMVFQAYLKHTPFKATYACNGKEGVDLFLKEDFDIVFMDIQMPEMDGFAATQAIRKMEKQLGKSATPIIALTAYGYKEEIQKCLESGCNQHLTKPVKKTTLIRTIEEKFSALNA